MNSIVYEQQQGIWNYCYLIKHFFAQAGWITCIMNKIIIQNMGNEFGTIENIYVYYWRERHELSEMPNDKLLLNLPYSNLSL